MIAVHSVRHVLAALLTVGPIAIADDWALVDAVRASIKENATRFAKGGRARYRVERSIHSSRRTEDSVALIDIRWRHDRHRITMDFTENVELHQEVPKGVPKKRLGVRQRYEFLALPKQWLVWIPAAEDGRGRLTIYRPGAVLDCPYADMIYCHPFHFFRRGFGGQGPFLDDTIGPKGNHPSRKNVVAWELEKSASEPSLASTCTTKNKRGQTNVVTTWFDTSIALPVRRTAITDGVPNTDGTTWQWRYIDEFGAYAIESHEMRFGNGSSRRKWTLLEIGSEVGVPDAYFTEENLKVLRLASVEDKVANKRYFKDATKPLAETELRKAAKSESRKP